MPALRSDLRRQLEHVIIQARELVEGAARATLRRLGVDAIKPFEHFNEEQREQRNRLRARARQAGDQRKPNGEQEIDQLTQELAYEYWHRMLFAQFLAENNLLMHPDGVSVSLVECDELAKLEGADNGWVLAARYASRMLPQIFRTDDVLLEVEFPINDRLLLEKLLASLPSETFTADDSLGWVYQFWQSKKKDEVNRSGQKIDGRTLPAVTQLFTEPYMVKFLLHNTIGAWWCARYGIKGPPGGAGVPAGQAPIEMEYLRWRDDGMPAAGTFDRWPKSLKEFTMLDPCCGSGHFLVEAFHLLMPLRMHDERLSAKEACEAVLSENLFGLELDPRCTQIAAFALALAAWKYPDESGEPLGYRPLPTLNIACSGQSVTGKKEEWLALANGDNRLLEGMDKLYDLFQQAPHLGSLIDPRREVGDLIAAGFAELQPLLEKAMAKEKIHQDADAVAVGVAAQGIAKAAEFLGKQYTLVSTNVPYLGRIKQDGFLRRFCTANYPLSQQDLSTVFMEHCINLARSHVAMVVPLNWCYGDKFRKLRIHFLEHRWISLFARLGTRAFEMISGEVVNIGLIVFQSRPSDLGHYVNTIDASTLDEAIRKANALKLENIQRFVQKLQLNNPDARITFSDPGKTTLLSSYAKATEGLSTGDGERYLRKFWELVKLKPEWCYIQDAPDYTAFYRGMSDVVLWERGKGELASNPAARIRGHTAWGKRGILLTKMNSVRATVYHGGLFSKSCVVIAPNDESLCSAIFDYALSGELEVEVNKLDTNLSTASSVFDKVPFDPSRWQAIGQDKDIPEPYSDDSSQWLFKGDISSSSDPLQVAVSLMLGYRWPEQFEEENAIDILTDKDGIVCIPAVRGERPATDRLLDVLRTAHGSQWLDATLHKLLTDAECRPGMSLDEWMREKLFEQHCKRFHQLPFIWHIWDGRKDGFSCLVNYHMLDHKRLETLTYSYLQDWINSQAASAKEGRPGADLRLAAAQGLQHKLKLILEGEPPYDIFVRWKPIQEQPIGWNPDLNDGVRVNIRPFMTADVLRKKPNINWKKDRGKEPERDRDDYPWFWKDGEFTGDRINDYHLTNAQKRAARERASHA